MQKAYIIYGPTSSGKTSKAIEMAKKLNGEVISADSRQIYRGLDLATGKVTKKETDGITHHLIDIKNPGQNYSAVQFTKDANFLIQDIFSKNKIPIIAGGTAFYLYTLLSGAEYPSVPLNTDLRKKLDTKNILELKEELKKIDPSAIDKIDTKNKIRLIRAIEISTKLGTLPETKYSKINFEYELIILNPPKDELNLKIKKRLKDRLEDGLLEEILATKLRFDTPWSWFLAQGLELKHGALFHTGKCNLDDFIANCSQETINYAKRQRTWIKKLENIKE